MSITQMASSYSASYSNQFETLYEMLRDRLYGANIQPFAPRRIVVPSGAVKEWLQRQFAFDSHVGIAAGLTFFTLESAAREVTTGFQLPSPLELALRIESELPSVLEEFPESAIALYLREGDRVSSISRRLAHRFCDYALYGREMVANWERGWQAALWSRLFKEGEWLYPQVTAQEGWYLFGFCHLAPAHLDLFCSLGARFYLLTPTPHYWGDLATDGEAVRIRRMGKERGVSQESLDEMTDYLGDRNSLLANLGRLGRPLMAHLAEAPESEERFVEPDRTTLLTSIQADLFALEPPSIEVADLFDSSIAVCGLSSKMGEIEWLRDRIVSWLGKDGSRTPSQILVLAPDISHYLPYIEAVFGAEEPLLPYQVVEGGHPSQGSLGRGLLLLLELATSRWEAGSFLALLEHPLFAARHRLSCEDVSQIRSWLVQADIRWGEDGDHRRSLLESCYGEEPKAVLSKMATWSAGLGRLLDGLAVGQIEMSRAELLGQLIDLFYQLRAELAPFAEEEEAPVEEWAHRLRTLVESHFSEWNESMKWIGELARVGRKIGEKNYRFTSIAPWVEEQLGLSSRRRSVDDLGAIRFCSIAPMQVVPAEMICLIGMEEGALPRAHRQSPLDELKGLSSPPTPGDRDRYFFLEAILSARSALLITYPAISQAEGVAQPPSLLVDELLAYVEHHYKGAGQIASTRLEPSYHKSWFAEGESSSKRRFMQAKAYYGAKEPCEFVASPPSIHLPAQPARLALNDLRTAACRPCRLYFREQLHLTLEERKEIVQEEESFALPYRHLEKLIRASLVQPIDQVVAEASQAGILPGGTFHSMGRAWLHGKVDPIMAGFQTLEVDPGSGFWIDLCPATKERERCEGGWRVPSIQFEVSGHPIELVGRLDWTLPAGYPALAKRETKEIFKRWPDYLVHAALAARGDLDLLPDLLFAESGRSERIVGDPTRLLKQMVHYTLLCRENLCPVLPSWSQELLQGDVNRLYKKWNEVQDPYHRWLWPSLEKEEIGDLVAVWREPLHEAFGVVAEQWGVL